MRKLLYLSILIFTISCSSEKNSEENETIQDSQNTENTIELSPEQQGIAKIETSKIEKKKMADVIKSTGNIEVPPHFIASVSPVMEGFIQKINYYPGNFVEKGAVLASLQHPDFIILQQNYIEAKSQFEYYKEEYKRQGELTVENAASIKKMQQAKSDYLTSEAKYKSLKSQLNLLGVDVESIEKGDFVTEFKVIAPISGKVAQLQANIGKHVSSDEAIVEIINESELYLNLNIFEKDIRKIKVGQNIQFHLLNDEKIYESKVSRIGIKVEDKDRTTLVQSIIKNTDKELKPGMHVISAVLIKEHEVYAIQSDAIVESDGKSYLFIKDNSQFEIVEIERGMEQNQYTEIREMDKKLLDADIVTNGVYYLVSMFEAGE